MYPPKRLPSNWKIGRVSRRDRPSTEQETDPREAQDLAPLTTPNGSVLPNLQSPTDFVGPMYTIPHPDADLLTVARIGMEGRNHDQLLGWNNPYMECYRNSLVLVLLFSGRLMSFLSNYHAQIAGHKEGYSDLLLVLLRLWLSYQWNDQDVDKEVAMKQFWTYIQGSDQWLWEPEDFKRQQDASEFLSLLFTIYRTELERPESQFIENGLQSFETMITLTLLATRRCPDCPANVGRRYGNQDLDILNVPIDKDKKSPQKSDVNFHELLPLAVGKITALPVRCDACYEKFGVFSDETRKDFVWQKINRLPEVLFTALNRFRHTGLSTSKVTTRVVLNEEIDLGPFCEDRLRGQPSRYKITGVVSHAGSSPKSGHYIAYVRDRNRWYRIDNTTVRQVSFDQISAANNPFNPYLMCWEKIFDDSTPTNVEGAVQLTTDFPAEESYQRPAQLQSNSVLIDGEVYHIGNQMSHFDQALFDAYVRSGRAGATGAARVVSPRSAWRRRTKYMARLDGALDRRASRTGYINNTRRNDSGSGRARTAQEKKEEEPEQKTTRWKPY